MLSARYRAFVSHLIKGVKSLQHVGWYRASFDSVRCIFSELSSSSVVKNAVACTRSGFGMSFFCPKTAEIIHHSFEVLPDRADVSALPMNVLTPLKAPSTLSTESYIKLFRSLQSPFAGEQPSVRKKNVLFETLSSMQMLQPFKSATQMNALRNLREQSTCFKTIWNRVVPA